jgi:hypothetical protein
MIDPRMQYGAGALPPDDDDKLGLTPELMDLQRQRFYATRASHDAVDGRESMDE